MDRRLFVKALGLAAATGALSRSLAAQQAPAASNAARAGRAQPAPLPTLTVYKDPGCGCCEAWIDHMKASGFTVTARNTRDLAGVKRELGVPSGLESCHTVVAANYLVEGHVPAADVKRMLAEKPAIRGIAVPGMPIGSPGMEQGPPSGYQRYDVIAFTAQGRRSVFARH